MTMLGMQHQTPSYKPLKLRETFKSIFFVLLFLVQKRSIFGFDIVGTRKYFLIFHSSLRAHWHSTVSSVGI